MDRSRLPTDNSNPGNSSTVSQSDQVSLATTINDHEYQRHAEDSQKSVDIARRLAGETVNVAFRRTALPSAPTH